MSDTLTNMEFVYVDILSPDQLLEGDFIEVNDDDQELIVKVIDILTTKEGYLINATNDFDEINEYFFTDDEKIKLFVLK